MEQSLLIKLKFYPVIDVCSIYFPTGDWQSDRVQQWSDLHVCSHWLQQSSGLYLWQVHVHIAPTFGHELLLLMLPLYTWPACGSMVDITGWSGFLPLLGSYRPEDWYPPLYDPIAFNTFGQADLVFHMGLMNGELTFSSFFTPFIKCNASLSNIQSLSWKKNGKTAIDLEMAQICTIPPVVSKWVYCFFLDDFSGPALSAAFPLGSLIPISATVEQRSHQPLLLLLEECMAADTAELQPNSQTYPIITNKGYAGYPGEWLMLTPFCARAFTQLDLHFNVLSSDVLWTAKWHAPGSNQDEMHQRFICPFKLLSLLSEKR